TFYGTTYAALYVNDNGLITFGSGNNSANNLNLTASPEQAAIAPLWSNWRTDLNADDQVLGKFEDTDGDGTPDRLILEWHQVQHAPNSPAPVTFQTVLELNTGAAAGAVVFNYPNLDAADLNSGGLTAAVGIKDEGSQGPTRLLVSFNGLSPFVGSGQAVEFTAGPADGPGRGPTLAATLLVPVPAGPGQAGPTVAPLRIGDRGTELAPDRRGAEQVFALPAQQEAEGLWFRSGRAALAERAPVDSWTLVLDDWNAPAASAV